ncbi:MAG: hypothetical protein WCL32_13225 [Planctomycetota bacterium]
MRKTFLAGAIVVATFVAAAAVPQQANAQIIIGGGRVGVGIGTPYYNNYYNGGYYGRGYYGGGYNRPYYGNSYYGGGYNRSYYGNSYYGNYSRPYYGGWGNRNVRWR